MKAKPNQSLISTINRKILPGDVYCVFPGLFGKVVSVDTVNDGSVVLTVKVARREAYGTYRRALRLIVTGNAQCTVWRKQ